MSKTGALSKKELAEAGRRKLEEFKKKKQQAKGTKPDAVEAGPASIPAAPVPAAPPTAGSTLVAVAAEIQQPTINCARHEAGAEPATASPEVTQAATLAPTAALPVQPVSFLSSTAPVPAFQWHGSPGSDDGALSTAARAAAAGAAAAALEAALMGLPSASTAATVGSSSNTAEGAASFGSPLPQYQTAQRYPWDSPANKQQQPASLAVASPSKPAQAYQHQQPVLPVGLGTGPVENNTTGPATAAENADVAPVAAFPAHAVGMPDAVSAGDRGCMEQLQQQQRGSSWLSMFSGRSGSADSQDQQQNLQQHRRQVEPTPTMQGGAYSGLLPYSSHRTPQPSSPGGAAVPPVPWIPGAPATAPAATQPQVQQSRAAAGLPTQPWVPGMAAASDSSTGTAAGANIVDSKTARRVEADAGSSTSMAPPGASSYSNLADTYLSSPAAGMQPAGGGVPAAVDSRAGPAAARANSAAVASSYASLSDTYLLPAATSSKAGAPLEPPHQQTEVANGGQQQHPAATDHFAVQANSGPRSLGSSTAALPDSHLQTSADAGASSSLALWGVPQQLQQQHFAEQHNVQLPNDLSRPGSFSNFGPSAVLAPEPGRPAGTPMENGVLHAPDKAQPQHPGSGIGLAALRHAANSITSGSIAGSGPPSTSGGLSYIQAHAESSQRSVERLKLLQQHIDELTTEKLELLRGLQQQARANEALAEDNRVLGEQHNKLAVQLEQEQKQVKKLEQEFAAAAANMAALIAERDAHRAAATEASDRANSLAAENVALENQLLEAKSAQLRVEKEHSSSATTIARLEEKLSQLSSSAGQAERELSGLQAERRIMKARLMQAEARMRAAGLAPLPPLPSSMEAQEAEPAPPLVAKVDAEVQACIELPQPRFLLPADTTALPSTVLSIAEDALVPDSAKKVLFDPVKINQEAATVLAGLAAWLPKDLLASAEAAATTAPLTTAAAAGSDGVPICAAEATADTTAVSALTGSVVWCEEARLATSVVGLAQQLEGTWGTVLDELEQERERNQLLQREADELQNQLFEVQRKCEVLQAVQGQQAEGGQLQQQLEASQTQQHEASGTMASDQSAAGAQPQQQLQIAADKQAGVIQQHEGQQPAVQQQQHPADGVQQLPVSVPAHSHTSSVQVVGSTSITGAPAAVGHNQSEYAADVNETSSVVGSVVGSSLSGTNFGQQWDDSSTASSKQARSKSWFGMFGRRGNNRAPVRSALV